MIKKILRNEGARLFKRYISISEFIKRKVFGFEDYIFEKRYSFDFGGIIENTDLIAENKIHITHASAYQAVWCRNLRDLYKEARAAGYSFENFIDIGSGKGKACIYIKQKWPSINVIGVEFSEPLIAVATKNKNKLPMCDITFVNIDACDFKLPNQRNFVFFFNPFDNIVLEKFISNNIDHFKKYDTVIGYANDIHFSSLEKMKFEAIFRNNLRKISLYRYTKTNSY